MTTTATTSMTKMEGRRMGGRMEWKNGNKDIGHLWKDGKYLLNVVFISSKFHNNEEGKRDRKKN